MLESASGGVVRAQGEADFCGCKDVLEDDQRAMESDEDVVFELSGVGEGEIANGQVEQ